MSFLLFERIEVNGKGVLSPTGTMYRLAGKNLLFRAWNQKGCPINSGWHVSADELIRLHTEGEHGYEAKRLVIDFDPNAKKRIGLVELLDVYAYTEGDKLKGTVTWTPIMLRLKDVFYRELDKELTLQDKNSMLASVSEPENEAPDCIEFLYVIGEGWNWGKNGRTNAAFIQGEARKYFRNFF